MEKNYINHDLALIEAVDKPLHQILKRIFEILEVEEEQFHEDTGFDVKTFRRMHTEDYTAIELYVLATIVLVYELPYIVFIKLVPYTRGSTNVKDNKVLAAYYDLLLNYSYATIKQANQLLKEEYKLSPSAFLGAHPKDCKTNKKSV